MKKKEQVELITEENLGKFRSSSIKKNFYIDYIAQLFCMLKRNTILQFRWWRSTLAQCVLAPLIFQLLLFVLQRADYARQEIGIPHPTSTPLEGVYPCQGRNIDTACISIMYTPKTATTDKIMQKFIAINSERISDHEFKIQNENLIDFSLPLSTLDIVPVPDSEFIYQYAFRNPNVTKWGITFTDANDINNPTFNLQYQIWVNYSLTSNGTDQIGRETLSLMRGLDEAIVSTLHDTSSNVKMEVSLKEWPTIPSLVVSDTIVQNLGPLVTEKELKLRIALEMMGYSQAKCILALNVFKYVSTSTRKCIRDTMIAFAFFITCFVRKSQVAIMCGIFVFIIGLLFESFVFSNSFVGFLWWENTQMMTENSWRILLLIPFFNFGKMFLDLTTLTTGRLDRLTQTYIPGPGFSWNRLYEPIDSMLRPSYNGVQPTLPLPVIPNEYGIYKSPLFFLMPSYWGFGNKDKKNCSEWLKEIKSKSGGIVIDNEDEEVTKERNIALNDENTNFAVRIINLRKVFQKSRFYKSKTDKIAVKDTCITFQEGKLLALLGQNGAGKSTSMNILSGLTPATKGDAIIYGFSVAHQMSEISKIMGVCPQHDILFGDLTAVEHIELYAGLKGIPKKDVKMLIEDRLKCVKLWQVRNTRANTYSGGMKRRLSLVISTIGDPKVIFMDEPTTGMDPVNRRRVWSFVENFKEGRVIVLTTHSMEEADVLGDRIAIMAHGSVKAIGNSITLKEKFGAGYRMNLITEPSLSDKIKEEVIKRVPGIVVEDESAGALIFQLPNKFKSHIPSFVDWLESNRGVGITTWGISQATLEEVFLKLIREANPNGYSGYEVGKK
ncbi:ATP-binding cassette sub- A member 1 [Lobulomyces angularis]|nr:ATP-binding cassette sub- A member 1 [Lobulomyces angularis]